MSRQRELAAALARWSAWESEGRRWLRALLRRVWFDLRVPRRERRRELLDAALRGFVLADLDGLADVANGRRGVAPATRRERSWLIALWEDVELMALEVAALDLPFDEYLSLYDLTSGMRATRRAAEELAEKAVGGAEGS